MNLIDMFKGQNARNCRLCKNHDLTIATRGHKKLCTKIQCICDKCTVERARQASMKLSIRNYRYAKRGDISKKNSKKMKLASKMLNECKPTIIKIIARYLKSNEFKSKMKSNGLIKSNLKF